MASRTLRVRFLNDVAVDYEIKDGGWWTYQVLFHVPCLVIRTGPGVKAGVRYPGRYEIPLMNVAHIELLAKRSWVTVENVVD